MLSVTSVAAAVGYVVLALSAGGAIYALGAVYALWRFLRRAHPPLRSAPSVTVLKPLHGDEPELSGHFCSLCGQDYPGPVQVIMGARNTADPALAVADRVRLEYPGLDILIAPDPTQHGTNRKISNLINMSAHAKGDLIVISDSDVRLPPEGLSRIVAALQRPGAGWYTACIADAQRPHLVQAGGDGHQRPLRRRRGGGRGAGAALLGPTMALRADVLEQVGGLNILADQLADDYVLGEAVRAAGLRSSRRRW